MKRTKNLWRTGILNLFFQIIFLLFLYFVGYESRIESSGIFKILFNFGLVFIPCVIWTLFFYLQDRIEPEPTYYVIIAFFVGMAIASLFQIPLEKYIFQSEKWSLTDFTSLVLDSFLLFGISISFIFYFGIRYGFYTSKEFDEPVDGMVYGAFIGSGFAAVKSLTYLSEVKDLTIFATGYTTSTNVLVYASIASLIGLYIGKAKFNQSKKNFNFLLGFLLGAFLLAIYNISTNLIYIEGSDYGFFYSFIMTMGLSIIMLITVFLEMRSLTKSDLHKDVKVDAKPDYLVLFVLIIFLIPGLIIRNNYLNDNVFSKDKISFKYSKNLITAIESRKISLFDQNLFTKENNYSKGAFKSLYSVILKKSATDLNQIDLERFINTSELQYPLNKEIIEINGIKSLIVKYSTVKMEENLYWYPTVILNSLAIIPIPNQTLIVSFTSTLENYQTDVKYYDEILKSIQILK